MREFLRIGLGEDDPRLSVNDGFSDGAAVGGNDWEAGCECFQHDTRMSFGTDRREEKYGGSSHQMRLLPFVDRREEFDVPVRLANPIAHLRLERGIVPRPGKYESRRRTLLKDDQRSFDRLLDALTGHEV